MVTQKNLLQLSGIDLTLKLLTAVVVVFLWLLYKYLLS